MYCTDLLNTCQNNRSARCSILQKCPRNLLAALSISGINPDAGLVYFILIALNQLSLIRRTTYDRL